MHRLSLFGVATAALALATPVVAQGPADNERAFARAARSFNACLASAATSAPAQPEAFRVEFSRACAMQEVAYRESSVRLRMSRGASEQQAESETDADIINGRRNFIADQARRYALAN